MTEVEYKISTYPSKSDGYQSKKGLTGEIKIFISTIWSQVKKWSTENQIDPFETFLDYINSIIIHERYCLARAFQKIKIKGGMCNPCCVMKAVDYTTEYLFRISFYDEVTS